ncbi:acetylxylan esterase [Paenibacillus sp. FSL W8-1187]|uniref:Acetyl xylan esterase n=1 Tax=Paenibacillus pasadenensis TaxID=217090 RepID=A0A2N5N101_9BACL|nr:acetylxylan esterase [Paenibacillus pasadenensis]PLT44003.1 Acetyl xylan esterase [Paenibacillus pasadenensis]
MMNSYASIPGNTELNHLQRRKMELQLYMPPLTMEKEKSEAFWQPRLKQAWSKPLRETRKRVDEELFPYADVYRITYEGYDETPVSGLYMVPAQAAREGRQVPCIVIYPGYTAGAGYPEDHAGWLLAGYAVLAVDARGQGGETGSLLPSLHGMAKGWMTQNLLEGPDRTYYMALFVDSLKALQAAASQPEVDARRLVPCGGSQGGGLALAVAALCGLEAPAGIDLAAVLADIPNLCHVDQAIFSSAGSLSEAGQLASRKPEELSRLLEHLACFDNMNLACRISAPVLASVGWKDPICPPETVYAAYNRIHAPKEIRDYPFLGHEVNGAHRRDKLQFVLEHAGR